MKKMCKLLCLALASLLVLPTVSFADETENSTFDITETTIAEVHKASAVPAFAETSGDSQKKELVYLAPDYSAGDLTG
ncbi:hypothetical protein ACFPYJ_15080, partial [Paenibacillus solisilvae]